MRSIVHISKFVVNTRINLTIIFYPNIYLFSQAFLSVVADGTLHFYLGLSINDLAEV